VISSQNLQDLALTSIQTLDAEGELRRTIFDPTNDSSWAELENVLSSSLPPDIVFNLTVFDIVTSSQGFITYRFVHSISSAEDNLGVGSEGIAYLLTTSNTTFMKTPKKVTKTLYILNCDDSNGWWITGYTGQTLATDLYNLLSPYVKTTVLVNSTYQLGLLLDNTTLQGETLQDAVLINTFGEAVPIPTSYANMYPRDSYAEYCYQLGKRVNLYNWTWVSIVGYPFYYVTNTVFFASTQNGWGIYGMKDVESAGLNSFLRGLNYPSYPSYSYDGTWITGSPGVVQFTLNASYYSNYYGIYPSPYQTSTRALPTDILSDYHLSVLPKSYIFQVVNNSWIAGATFNHKGSDDKIHGSFTAIGLTRTPDVRVSALAILMYYNPKLFSSEFTLADTSRLVLLQLVKLGGA